MDEYVRVASALPSSGGQLPTLVAIALILGLGKGGVPGLATIATAATVVTAPANVPGGLGYAVALMVPILTMIDVYAAYLHRSALDWGVVWILLPTSFVGMVIGQVVDGYMSDGGARLLVGIILLGILALRTWKDVVAFLCPSWAIRHQLSGDSRETKIESKESLDEVESERLLGELKDSGELQSTSSHLDVHAGHADAAPHSPSKRRKPIKVRHAGAARKVVWASIVGVIGGAATMLTNSMGPILNVYLLSVAKLSPQSYVGTRATFFCFLNLGKLPLRVWGGTLGMPMVPLAGGLGSVAVLGVFLAKPIMLGMDEKMFVKLELGVVAFAGLRLCYMGLKS